MTPNLTVKELIEKLQQHDPSAVVLIYDEAAETHCAVESVAEHCETGLPILYMTDYSKAKDCPQCGKGTMRDMTDDERETCKFDNAVAGVTQEFNHICNECGYSEP